VQARFYVDPATGWPHIKPDEDRPGREGSRVALGQTASGRYLRIIYVPDPEPDRVFVVTAYDLSGKELVAFRRRRKKKQQ
jgi:hypothetical protein